MEPLGAKLSRLLSLSNCVRRLTTTAMLRNRLAQKRTYILVIRSQTASSMSAADLEVLLYVCNRRSRIRAYFPRQLECCFPDAYAELIDVRHSRISRAVVLLIFGALQMADFRVAKMKPIEFLHNPHAFVLKSEPTKKLLPRTLPWTVPRLWRCCSSALPPTDTSTSTSGLIRLSSTHVVGFSLDPTCR